MTGKKRFKKAAAMMIALAMSAALFAGAVFASFAEEGGGGAAVVAKTDAATQQEPAPAPAPKTAKRATLGGFDITFSQPVRTDARLSGSCCTDSLKARGSAKSVKLIWNPVSNKGGIDGYIIIKKNNKQNRWYQIAAVGRNAKAFTDTKAAAKNTGYYYTILPYKNDGAYFTVANPARWACAVTTKSKKKNAYKVSFKSPAKFSSVAIGGTAAVSVRFSANRPFSKGMRWTSSDKKVATIDSKGKIRGKSHGVVTITGRTHTGDSISMKVYVIRPGTADAIIEVMNSWLGYDEDKNGRFRGILDIYNAKKPLVDGYRMRYSDEWCAACVSAAAIKSGTLACTGRGYNVAHFRRFASKRGRWEEDGSIVPQRGDIIIYGWDIGKKATVFDNNYWCSHVGVVESVSGKKITVIEGNKGSVPTGNGKVEKRTIPVGWRFIRGYARPKYRK